MNVIARAVSLVDEGITLLKKGLNRPAKPASQWHSNC
jgi:hypothetical protein